MIDTEAKHLLESIPSLLTFLNEVIVILKNQRNFLLQSVTIYSSEMSPPQYRGMLNLLFQWCTTIGIIIAQLINYGTVEIYEYGWRISLAIAAVPALMILFGGLLLPESPSSLISRNYHEEGRRVGPS